MNLYKVGKTGETVLRKFYDKYICFSWKGWLIFLLTMGAGTALCALLREVSTSDVHVPLIFVLAVLVISLTTDSYAYGLMAALISVFEVNWAFTYPYMKLDFSVYGYPLTFLTMLAVGIASSTLGWHMKHQHELELEAEKQKMRAMLLRSVSHDLRTPLTAISGSISAVLENEDMSHEERRELLENARQDSDWLNRMVENLLSVTKISGDDSVKINKSEEVLEEVLADAAAKFKNRHPGVSVEITPTDNIIFVPMDFMLVEQLLMNLMDNAVIHGKTTTCIRITPVENGQEVSVHVTDNGVGIREDLIHSLFEGSLNPEIGNGSDHNRFMGIGLAVCRTIAEAHNGKIEAHNRKDGGAEFVFTLPKGECNDEYQG